MKYSLAFSKGANANELNVSQPPSSEKKFSCFLLFLSLKQKLNTYNAIETNYKGLNSLLMIKCKIEQNHY